MSKGRIDKIIHIRNICYTLVAIQERPGEGDFRQNGLTTENSGVLEEATDVMTAASGVPCSQLRQQGSHW